MVIFDHLVRCQRVRAHRDAPVARLDPHVTSLRCIKSPNPTAPPSDFSDPPAPPPPVRDSRPEIAAWPAPPPTTSLAHGSNSNANNNTSNNNDQPTSDDAPRLLSILRAASASAGPPPRGRETELKRKIQTLEDTVAEYERQKYNVMGTFSEYRERVAERERKLEAEYSTKIITLSEEVLGAKKDFEARMKSFQALQDKFEREKEQALEKLRQEHQREIQLLEQRFSESQLLNLEQKYMIEIQRLEEERKSLKAEKERLGETFEMKLRRAQSLYETELQAAKMLYSKELEALRDHEEALKEELLARQDEFHDRLQELQHQSRRSREELNTCKNEVAALEKKLQIKEAEVQAISKELEEARNETNGALRKLSKVESELEETKQQYREQEEELQRKSNLLNIVETAKSKLEAVIRDLQTEVKALKNKVDFLEKERENLESQSESQTQLQNSQVHALEAVLETVTKEKETTKDQYEGLLSKERQQAESREHAMKKEFSIKLNELEEQYTNLKEELEHNAQLDKDEIREATHQEIETLKTENSSLQAEVALLKTKLFEQDEGEETDESVHLQKILAESQKLRDDLENSRQRMASKEWEIQELKKKLDQESKLAEEQVASIREQLRDELVSPTEDKDRIAELEKELSTVQMKREEDLRGYEAKLENVAIENERLTKTVQSLEESARQSSDDELIRQQLAEKETELEELRSERDRLKEEVDESVKAKLLEETKQMKRDFEAQLKEFKEAAQKESSEISKELQEVREDSHNKAIQIETLHSRVQDLLDEVGTIQLELEKKNNEIKIFSKKTDEYLRRREEQQESALQNKIDNLNAEHEKTIREMKAHEEELNEKIRDLERTVQERAEMDEEEFPAFPEVSEMCCQTDEMPVERRPIVDLAREKELSTRIEELEMSLQRKNELIQQLQDQIDIDGCDHEDCIHEGKKGRSQSVATAGEHMAMCQRASNKFQNLLSQMTDKKEKKVTGGPEPKKELKKEEKKETKDTKSPTKEKSPAVQRSKSPSLLTRLRERSPKARTPNLETQTPSTSTKNLLSPSDAERGADYRRGSPSRPLFSRSSAKKEVPAVKEPPPTSERPRPAWKF